MPRVKKLNDIAHAQLTLQDLEKGKIPPVSNAYFTDGEYDLKISLARQNQSAGAIYFSFRKKELLRKKRVIFYVVKESLFMTFTDDEKDGYKLTTKDKSNAAWTIVSRSDGVKLLSGFAGKWNLKKESIDGKLFYYIKLGENINE